MMSADNARRMMFPTKVRSYHLPYYTATVAYQKPGGNDLNRDFFTILMYIAVECKSRSIGEKL